MVKLILAVFDRLAWLWRWLGVDYSRFRAILEVKLTLDGRRVSTPFSSSTPGKPGHALGGTLLTYAIFGAAAAGALGILDSPLLSTTIVHAFIMMMTAMTLIADYSSVLLDSTDNAVLLPRPIDGRTILVARIAHIGTYLSLVVLSLSAATLVVGAFAIHRLFPVVFIATLVCSTALMVSLTSVFYLLAARWMNVEKFRDVVLYVQIAMTIMVAGGYQLFPRLMDVERVTGGRLVNRWWVYLIPPAWMAAPIDLLVGNVGTPQIVLTVLGVAVPALCFGTLVFGLGPRFTESLAALGSSPAAVTSPRRPAVRPRSVLRTLTGLVSRDPAQRAAFELTWQLCSRDRNFKLRTYPGFAIVLVVGVSLLFSVTSAVSLADAIAEVRDTKWHLVILYMGCMMVTACIVQLRYSNSHEAAWIYHVLPLRVPGRVLMGALKAVVLGFVLPVTAVLALLVLLICGGRVWLDLITAVGVTLLVSAADAMLLARRFPFSEAYTVAEGSGRVIWNLVAVLLVWALAGLHYLLTFHPTLLALYAVLVLAAGALVARIYACTSWATLRRINA